MFARANRIHPPRFFLLLPSRYETATARNDLCPRLHCMQCDIRDKALLEKIFTEDK